VLLAKQRGSVDIVRVVDEQPIPRLSVDRIEF
jgi:hypothetical protein